MKKVRIITASVAVAGAVALMAFTLKNNATGTKAVAAEELVKTDATWALDRSHSNISFSVEHMMVSEVEGKFRKFDGTLTADKEDFTDAQTEFTVDVASIDTDDEKTRRPPKKRRLF